RNPSSPIVLMNVNQIRRGGSREKDQARRAGARPARSRATPARSETRDGGGAGGRLARPLAGPLRLPPVHPHPLGVGEVAAERTGGADRGQTGQRQRPADAVVAPPAGQVGGGVAEGAGGIGQEVEEAHPPPRTAQFAEVHRPGEHRRAGGKQPGQHHPSRRDLPSAGQSPARVGPAGPAEGSPVSTIRRAATSCPGSASSTLVASQEPIGASTSTGCSGCPSHDPLNGAMPGSLSGNAPRSPRCSASAGASNWERPSVRSSVLLTTVMPPDYPPAPAPNAGSPAGGAWSRPRPETPWATGAPGRQGARAPGHRGAP